MTDTPDKLMEAFVDAVADADASVEAKAEIVINLAKAWGVAEPLLKRRLTERFGPDSLEHPYFHWRPTPKFSVGDGVRVVDGAPQVIGRPGRVTAVEDPRRFGVRGMARPFFYTVVFVDAPEPWGFREEQLEGHAL